MRVEGSFVSEAQAPDFSIRIPLYLPLALLWHRWQRRAPVTEHEGRVRPFRKRMELAVGQGHSPIFCYALPYEATWGVLRRVV